MTLIEHEAARLMQEAAATIAALQARVDGLEQVLETEDRLGEMYAVAKEQRARAEKAEQQVAKLREALEPFAEMGRQLKENDVNWENWWVDTPIGLKAAETSDFENAREALATLATLTTEDEGNG